MNKKFNAFRVIIGGLGLITTSVGLMFLIAPISDMKKIALAVIMTGGLIAVLSGGLPVIMDLNKRAKSLKEKNSTIVKIHSLAWVPLVGMLLSSLGVFLSPLSHVINIGEFASYILSICSFIVFFIIATILRLLEIFAVSRNDVDVLREDDSK